MNVLKLTLLVAWPMIMNGCAGFGPHKDLLVPAGPSEAVLSPAVPQGEVRIAYLGTNGYLFQSSSATVLVDPYFSRIGLIPIALNMSIRPNIDRIDSALAELPEVVDLILVTHAHFDHLLDVAEVARRTGALVVASPTGCFLVRAMGTPAGKTVPVLPGDSKAFGSVEVQVFGDEHGNIVGSRPPFPGVLSAVPDRPRRPSEWVLGEQLAFRVGMDGKRIYVDSGGTVDVLPSPAAGPVDLAILCVALPDNRERLVAAIHRLRPRYVLPTHQDDFFRPISKGFRFGPLTDFGAVRRDFERLEPPGKLILIDYFKPWTLK